MRQSVRMLHPSRIPLAFFRSFQSQIVIMHCSCFQFIISKILFFRYVICKDRKNKNCFATGYFHNDRFVLSRRHSHPSDQFLQLVDIFMRALYDSTVRSLRAVKAIYVSISILYVPLFNIFRNYTHTHTHTHTWAIPP